MRVQKLDFIFFLTGKFNLKFKNLIFLSQLKYSKFILQLSKCRN